MLSFVNCKWKLNKKENLTCFVLFLNLLWCEVKRKLFYDAKTMFKSTLGVADFTLFCVVWLSFYFWCHAPVVIIVSRFILGY